MDSNGHCACCTVTWSRPDFPISCHELLASSERAQELHSAHEELIVRMESLGQLWEDIHVLRMEMETRVARAELRLAGVTNPSTVQLLERMTEVASQWEDGWSDVERRFRSATAASTAQAQFEGFAADIECHVDVVREGLNAVQASRVEPLSVSVRSWHSGALTDSVISATMLRIKLVRCEPQASSVLLELDHFRRRCAIKNPIAWFGSFADQSLLSVWICSGDRVGRVRTVPVAQLLDAGSTGLEMQFDDSVRVQFQADVLPVKPTTGDASVKIRGL